MIIETFNMNKTNNFFRKKTIFLIILIFLNSCSGGKIWNPAPVKDVPVNEADRVAKNIEEGRGFKLLGGDKSGGTFQFASSNPLWRASLNVLDFMPITNASYSGGIIITDWYSDSPDSAESIKITVKFLSNEIRPDALDLQIFKKECKSFENCQSTISENQINSELKLAILKKATQLKKSDLKKKKN